MTEDVRAVLWRVMRERGLTTPEAFAARTGRRLCDLTPEKALAILTTPAIQHHPFASSALSVPRGERETNTGEEREQWLADRKR